MQVIISRATINTIKNGGTTPKLVQANKQNDNGINSKEDKKEQSV